MGRNRRELWGKGPTTCWELIDTEDEHNDINALLGEYRLAFGPGWEFEIR